MFAPPPEGVPLPPIVAAQAQLIKSAFAKLLLPGTSPSCLHKEKAMGVRIAATAMSVIKSEIAAPPIKKPRSTLEVLFPVIVRINMAIRVPSPDLVIATAKTNIPMKKTTVLSPKPDLIISLKPIVLPAAFNTLEKVSKITPKIPVI